MTFEQRLRSAYNADPCKASDMMLEHRERIIALVEAARKYMDWRKPDCDCDCEHCNLGKAIAALDEKVNT